MSGCERLSDQMPAVAHGQAEWSAADREHLESCPDCAAEWQLVQRVAVLGHGVQVSADLIAERLVVQLREAPAHSNVRTIPWRGVVSGLAAIAATLVVVLAVPHHRRAPVVVAAVRSDSGATVLPELASLDDAELQELLQSLGPTAADATPGVLPHLGDLTDSELQQLLTSVGGE